MTSAHDAAADMIEMQADNIRILREAAVVIMAAGAAKIEERDAEIAELRAADGLAREALRRAGYLDDGNAGAPLHELIEAMRVDARAAIQAAAQGAARRRWEAGR